MIKTFAYVNNISALRAWDILKLDNSIMVDVRTDMEHKLHGVADLSSINKVILFIEYKQNEYGKVDDVVLMSIKYHLKDLDSKIVVICKSGVRSLLISNILVQLGYKFVYNIYDGFCGNSRLEDNRNIKNGWINSNLPWKKDCNE